MSTANRRAHPRHSLARTRLLRCNVWSQQAVQELRRKISAVGPSDRPDFRIDHGSGEKGDASKRLKDLALQLVSQVNYTLGAIAEAEPKDMVSHMSYRRDT